MKLFEYRCGLLHAKTMLVDRKVGLIGSANLDRRSFELNFENNILFDDEAVRGGHPRPAGRIIWPTAIRSRRTMSTASASPRGCGRTSWR